MKREYSLAHLTVLSLSPPHLVEVAARTGYDFVGVRMTRVTPAEVLYPLATDRALRDETKVRMADTGVRIHDIELLRMDPTLDADHFLPCLEAGAELGARHAIAQLPDPDRERATARFARLCDLAKPLNIFVSLEFPHWTETGNLAEATKVVRAVNRSNAGVLVDMLHFGRSDSSLDELAKLPREWFGFAHVCDAAKEVPPTMAGIIRTARDERQFPGEGGIEVREILACLPPDIPYALEIPRATLTKAVGPEGVARLALLVAKSHLETTQDGSMREPRPAADARVPAPAR
jgi:sugar phosphate isomerase/epimerase